MDDRDDPEFLRPARRRRSLQKNCEPLHCFYSTASKHDAHLLDLALSYRETCIGTICQARDSVPFDVRIAYENMCNALEQTFVCLREWVRTTETFQRLQPHQQREIVHALDDIT